MDSFLLYKDSYTDGKNYHYAHRDMCKDLNLEILFRTMAREDPLISDKVRKVTMIPLTTPEEIIYRQDIINDFYNHTGLITKMYESVLRQERTLQTYKDELKKTRGGSGKKSGEILDTINFLKQGQQELIKLNALFMEFSDVITSEGLKNLFNRFKALPLKEIENKLDELDFYITGGEMHYTFRFGGGLKIADGVFNYCETREDPRKKNKQNALQSLYQKFIKKNIIMVSNDDALKHDLSHLTEFTVQQILKVMKPYLSGMMSFFEHFIEEVSFYMGTIRFMKRMSELEIPLRMPVPQPIGSTDTSFKNLYELSMAIYVQRKPIGNSLELHNNKMTIITGANQGGKSTFLRSYGIAQVMMQCGLPVPADQFTAPIYTQVFTHFTRREDEQLNSGRLREELQRMSNMIKVAKPHCIFLLNESFASTTEKEGSRIADGILRAFYEKDITTMTVTHLYQLAKNLYDEQLDGTAFLVAERKEGGMRTFRMIPGEPSHTSYGTDLFIMLEKEI